MIRPPAAEAAPPRVLIVDDDRRDRDLLKVMLGPEGFVLLTATSGEDALSVTAREQPDIILLDVMMPGMDGYQVVAKLKRNPATMNIPVIMITALDDRNARMLGLDAGAEDFLSKPLDRAELKVRVRNLLRLKAYSDQQREYGEELEGEVSSRTAQVMESEKRYRQIVESTTDGIVKLDVAAVVVFANGRFANMLGYELSELIGKSAFSLMDPEGAKTLREALERRGHGVAEAFDIGLRRKDGAELAVSLASTPILDEQERYVGALASARDVTEQRRLMAQLTLSDRMASIGTLAAGVAHEINNPLACVLANLDLAARDVLKLATKLGVTVEFAEVCEELRDAREGTERIRDIVRDLKIFSHSEEEETGPVDIHRVLDSTLRMAWNEIRHRASLVKNYGSTPPVEASEARLGQVFLNLVVNAAQAIAEGNAEDNEIRISTATDAAGRVTIEIADTGPGMPPEVLCRLFTPFFTTKPVGVGTGLGLSICHRIITSFGGAIEVTSEVGKGTAFRISLPASHAEVPEAVLDVAVDVAAFRHGRILVVDDEPLIGKALQRAMCEEHEVVAFTSASHALEAIVAGDCFDVILCDLMMPQMTGMDLHEALVRVAPEQASRMIFLSGGEFTERARAFVDTTSNQRLEKPFDVRQLRALINERIR
jgi:PAS domain S-box-containing protein